MRIAVLVLAAMLHRSFAALMKRTSGWQEKGASRRTIAYRWSAFHRSARLRTGC
jgi:hypothetical protein